MTNRLSGLLERLARAHLKLDVFVTNIPICLRKEGILRFSEVPQVFLILDSKPSHSLYLAAIQPQGRGQQGIG